MSKIIKKKEIDLVIENTLKEAGLKKDVVTESTDDLVTELKKNVISEEAKKELSNFNRFVNHKL